MKSSESSAPDHQLTPEMAAELRARRLRRVEADLPAHCGGVQTSLRPASQEDRTAPGFRAAAWLNLAGEAILLNCLIILAAAAAIHLALPADAPRGFLTAAFAAGLAAGTAAVLAAAGVYLAAKRRHLRPSAPASPPPDVSAT